jgi:hypothetical protein
MKTNEVFETNQQLADDMGSWKRVLPGILFETPSAVYTKSIPGTATNRRI